MALFDPLGKDSVVVGSAGNGGISMCLVSQGEDEAVVAFHVARTSGASLSYIRTYRVSGNADPITVQAIDSQLYLSSDGLSPYPSIIHVAGEVYLAGLRHYESTPPYNAYYFVSTMYIDDDGNIGVGAIDSANIVTVLGGSNLPSVSTIARCGASNIFVITYHYKVSGVDYYCLLTFEVTDNGAITVKDSWITSIANTRLEPFWADEGYLILCSGSTLYAIEINTSTGEINETPAGSMVLTGGASQSYHNMIKIEPYYLILVQQSNGYGGDTTFTVGADGTITEVDHLEHLWYDGGSQYSTISSTTQLVYYGRTATQHIIREFGVVYSQNLRTHVTKVNIEDGTIEPQYGYELYTNALIQYNDAAMKLYLSTNETIVFVHGYSYYSGVYTPTVDFRIADATGIINYRAPENFTQRVSSMRITYVPGKYAMTLGLNNLGLEADMAELIIQRMATAAVTEGQPISPPSEYICPFDGLIFPTLPALMLHIMEYHYPLPPQ